MVEVSFTDMFEGPGDESGFGEVVGSNSGGFPNLDLLLEEGVHDSQGHHDERFPGYHPSQISSSNCLRFFVLHSLPEVEVSGVRFNYDTLQIFDVGHDTHDWIQKYLRKYLTGTWKFKSCHGLINVRKEFVDHIQTFRESNRSPVTDLMARVITTSSEPIHEPTECPLS